MRKTKNIMPKWLRRSVQCIGLLIISVIALLVFITDSNPHDEKAIKAYTAQLFEYGATRFIHRQADDLGNAQALALFKTVGNGQPLSRTDSCIYRTAYHQLVSNNATMFGLLDNNTHFAENFGPVEPNNCDGHGIAGKHDLHDISARNNFIDLRVKLASLAQGSVFTRFYRVNDINKSLVDLMVHFAPAVHGIGVRHKAFDVTQNEELTLVYRAMTTAFKQAQFEPVNTCTYWNAIDRALIAYGKIVGLAQAKILSHASSLERKIAGRWLSLQTVAPILDLNDPVRPRPTNC